MTPFPHDGSEIDDLVYADWLDDHGRYDEADELRGDIDEGPNLSEWVYEGRYVGRGGVGGYGGGVGGYGGYGGLGGGMRGVGGSGGDGAGGGGNL